MTHHRARRGGGPPAAPSPQLSLFGDLLMGGTALASPWGLAFGPSPGVAPAASSPAAPSNVAGAGDDDREDEAGAAPAPAAPEDWWLPEGADRGLARGWRARALANAEAVRLSLALERGGRHPDAAERATLARFVGYGATDLAEGCFRRRAAASDDDGATGKGDSTDTTGFRRGYEEAGAALEAALPEAEVAGLARSTQYAHYTPEWLARAAWAGLRRLGFGGGAVLEPGAGVGVFAATVPAACRARTAFVLVERDAATARVLRLLHPNHRALAEDFAACRLAPGAFDAAVGNPPFSDLTVRAADPAGKLRLRLHDYFVARSVASLLRPGGVAAFVVGQGFLDKADPSARAHVHAEADLLGAVRLPEGAFRADAGTDVGTDLVFFRRRLPGEAPGDAAWVGPAVEVPAAEGGDAEAARVNPYFAARPDAVLGVLAWVSGPFGPRVACLPDDAGLDALPARVADAIRALLPEGVHVPPRDAGPDPLTGARERAHAATPGDDQREGSFLVGEHGPLRGALCQVVDGRVAEVPIRSAGAPAVPGAMLPKHARIVRGLVAVRDAVRAVLRAQAADRPWGPHQARLGVAYRSFVRQFGPVNLERRHEAAVPGRPGEAREVVRRPNLEPFLDDPDCWLVAACEEYDPDSGEARPGAVFDRRVVRPPAEARVESAADALAVCLHGEGRVVPRRVSELMGGRPWAECAALLGGAVYEVPPPAPDGEEAEGDGDPSHRDPPVPVEGAAGEGADDAPLPAAALAWTPGPAEGTAWETADAYLSGRVRAKLRDALAAAARDPARWGRNVAALRDAQPPELRPSEIFVRLGAPWIPAADVTAFAREVLGAEHATIRHSEAAGVWSVRAADFAHVPSATTDWGTHRRHAGDLLDDALNGGTPRIHDLERGPHGEERRVFNAAETEAAKDKLRAIQVRFGEWIWEDPGRADRLASLYNLRFNDLAPREFDAAHLHPRPPGMSDAISLRDHQRRCAWRIVASGNTYLAQSVGSGKTAVVVVACMEQRRLGLVTRPLVVVPNHTLVQWAREWLRLYPDARILVADERNFARDRRRRFLARAATGEWDAVVVSHSAFGFLAAPREFQGAMAEEAIRDLDEALSRVDGEDRIGRKRIERLKEGLEERLRATSEGTRRDDLLDVSEVGVDQIVVDECLPYGTPVLTEIGWREIGWLVEHRANIRVLSFNLERRRAEWKPIVRWLDRGRRRDLVRIEHEQGSLACTPEHKVALAGGGYARADELTPGQELLVLPQAAGGRGAPWPAVLRPDVPRRAVAVPDDGHLRAVRGDVPRPRPEREAAPLLLEGVLVHREEGGPEADAGPDLPGVRLPIRDAAPGVQARGGPPLLLGLVRADGAVPAPGREGEVRGAHRAAPGRGEQGPAQPGGVRAHADPQPDGEPRLAREDEGRAQGADLSVAGRQGEDHAAAAGAGGGARAADGVHHTDGPGRGQVRVPPALLPGGHRGSLAEAGDRGGREDPQDAEVALPGRAEDCGVVRSRVVRVEVHERGGGRGSGGLRGDGEGEGEGERVFDLEVADNHNFVAAGVLVSNCQQYRKLGFATNQATLKGVDPHGSARAWDLFVKGRWVETVNPGRALVLASGTPVTNTLGELYTAQRFLDPAALRARGVHGFDAWAAAFADATTSLELQPTGQYKPVTRLSSFRNVPELVAMFRSFADVLTREGLARQLPPDASLPRVLGGGPRRLVTAAPTDTFRAHQRHLARRVAAIEACKGPPKKGDDILLSVITDGRHAAVDLRLVGYALDEPANKLNRLVAEVHRIWLETSGRRYALPDGRPAPVTGALQMVFSDLGTPAVEDRRGFSAYHWIRERLVALGVPASEVRFMQDHKTSAEKARLFADCLAGRCRVLVGSSETMGTGVNVQQRLYALHHLDVPWLPSQVEQREGRIVRQGNGNPEVEVLAYATLGSMDATMWQANERKARFIEAALSGDRSVRVLEDVGAGDAEGYAMAKAIASGDARLMRRAGLEAEVARLGRLAAAHRDERLSLGWRAHDAGRAVAALNRRLPGLEADDAARVPTRGEAFRMEVAGRLHDERRAAGAALLAVLRGMEAAVGAEAERRVVARLGGFDLAAEAGWEERDRRGQRAMFTGRPAFSVRLSIERAGGVSQEIPPAFADGGGGEDGDRPGVGWVGWAGTPATGLVARLENAIERVPSELVGARRALAEETARLAALEARAGQPFALADEHAERAAELAALDEDLARTGSGVPDADPDEEPAWPPKGWPAAAGVAWPPPAASRALPAAEGDDEDEADGTEDDDEDAGAAGRGEEEYMREEEDEEVA